MRFKNPRNKSFVEYLCVILCLAFLSTACQPDDYTETFDTPLAFSTDTVFFDTVFTSFGTATLRFKAYNRSSKNIRVQRIQLAGGESSPYRLNVDGQSGLSFEQVDIGARDSIFIFVDVNIDPQNESNPFVVVDSLVFQSTNHLQDVKLVAYGRDAYIHRGSRHCNERWQNDKPHVVVDAAYVDSNCTLEIDAGTEVYFSNGAGLVVFGQLQSQGTVEQPNKFLHFRRESGFDNQPGQWYGLWFLPSSGGNVLENTLIRNPNFGLRIDSLSPTAMPKVLLNNVQIDNPGQSGILGYTAEVVGLNVLINNFCNYAIQAELGGNYEFVHASFIGSNCFCTRRTSSLAFSNQDFVDLNDNTVANDLNVTILNSIIWGNSQEEINFIGGGAGEINIGLDYNLIRTQDEGILELENHIFNENPNLQAACSQDFMPRENSAVIGFGNPEYTRIAPILEKDIYGHPRNTTSPTLGAVAPE